MTLLTAIQAACNELGLASPASVIGNTDSQVVQLLALANREGWDWMGTEGPWGGWPELRKEYRFNLASVGPFTGTFTTSSKTVTAMSSVAGLAINTFGVTGTGIPQSTFLTAVGTTTVTLSDFPTAAGTAASLTFPQIAYALPSDLQYFITDTQWDRNFRWQMVGPLDAQEWQTLQSGLMPTGPRFRFRVMNNLMYINPPPSATQTDTIAYEYVSNAYCTNASGTAQTAFAADTDLYVWDQNYLTLGIKWRFLRAKGFDYAEEKKLYDDALQQQLARSGGSRDVPLNASAGRLRLLNGNNIPDSGFGV